MTKAELTPWYPAEMNPVRVGVYRTGNDWCAAQKHDCGAYAYWDGARWLSYGRWAEYHQKRMSGFWWRGLDRKTNAEGWRVEDARVW